MEFSVLVSKRNHETVKKKWYHLENTEVMHINTKSLELRFRARYKFSLCRCSMLKDRVFAGE